VGGAALVATALTYPMDVVRARLTLATDDTTTCKNVQARRGNSTTTTTTHANRSSRGGIVHTFQDIYSKDGVAGLYRGLSPTLIAVVPFIAIQGGAIEWLRDEAIDQGMDASPRLLLAVGVTAGMLAQTAVYPLEVLRRRMQVWDLSRVDPTVAPNERTSSFRKLVSILRHTRLRKYYSGILPTFLKIVPGVAVATLVTEPLNQGFKDRNIAHGLDVK